MHQIYVALVGDVTLADWSIKLYSVPQSAGAGPQGPTTQLWS